MGAPACAPVRRRARAGDPRAPSRARSSGHRRAIVAAGQHAVREPRGRALVLACGGMAEVATASWATRGRTGDERRRLRRADRVRALASEPADEPGRVTGAARAGERVAGCAARHARLSMFAATFREYGGPEVMRWEQIPDPVPGTRGGADRGASPAASITPTSTRGRARRAGRSRSARARCRVRGVHRGARQRGGRTMRSGNR